jgi:hypothetical protein
MIDEQKLEKAFDDLDAIVKGKGGAVAKALPANIDFCGLWHNIRGTVDVIIAGLQAVGTIVPIAKKAAAVLETLKNILNGLCP